jgi:hypothetical protein
MRPASDDAAHHPVSRPERAAKKSTCGDDNECRADGCAIDLRAGCRRYPQYRKTSNSCPWAGLASRHFGFVTEEGDGKFVVGKVDADQAAGSSRARIRPPRENTA